MNQENQKPSLSSRCARHPFFSTFLLALAFLGLTAVSFQFLFQLCDDIFVLLLLKGAGMSPAPSEYNLFLNAFLSMGLNGLYACFPGIQWYSLFLVSVQALALWALLLACQYGPHRGLKTLLTLLGSAAFIYLLTVLQWTTASAFAAIGGIILLLALWRDKDRKPHGLPLAVVFILLLSSVLIRPASFFLILVLALPAFFMLGWKAVISPARAVLVKFMAVTALTLFAAMGANALYYHRSPEWARAVRFFDFHSDLINGHNLHYDETTKPIFDSIGWTQNDLDLFKNWYFLDEDTYSMEKLKTLGKSFPRFDMDKNAQESPKNIFFLPTVQCVFWSALFFLYFIPRSGIRFVLGSALWTFLVLSSLWLYLKLPERVFLPAMLMWMNLIVLNAASKGDRPSGASGAGSRGRKRVGVAVLVVVGLINLNMLLWEKSNARLVTKDWPELNEAMNRFAPKKDDLVVIWDSAFPYIMIPAFNDFEFFEKMNLATLVWFQRTPTTKAMLERFGVKNLFRDMVDNQKVFLICTPWEVNVYKVYMIRKYDMTTELVPSFTSPLFTAYQVRSVKNP